MDLDNEELEATRKLHGLDKINGSDINVDSIEKAIKIVKSLIENTKESLISNTKLSQNRKTNRTIGYKALEILLSDYTKQKQINEEHQKENGLLREKVKELEEENLHWRGQYHLITRKIDIIPKQKIKDKIEKLNKEIKNGDEIEAIFKIKQQQILQELLEELGV